MPLLDRKELDRLVKGVVSAIEAIVDDDRESAKCLLKTAASLYAYVGSGLSVHGRGSISPTGSGKLQVRVYHCGKRYTVGSFVSLDDANAALDTALAGLKSGTFTPVRRVWRKPKRRRSRGHVYFVSASESGAIKIGRAVDVKKRLEALGSGTHEKLTLLAAMPGGIPEEREVLERFSHLKIRGEWFRPEEELLSFIAELSAAR